MFWPSLAGKIVSVRPRPAAGLGALDVGDLSSLQPEKCLGISTGFECRSGACLCLSLGDPATLVEFKQLMRAATGTTPSQGALWTAADDALLLHWVDSITGSLGPHGLLLSGDVAKLGPNGHVTLTARGLRALLDEAGATEANYPIVMGLMAAKEPQQSVVPTEPVSSAAPPPPPGAPCPPCPHPEIGPMVAANLQPRATGIGRALGWSMVGATVLVGAYYLSTPRGRKLFA